MLGFLQPAGCAATPPAYVLTWPCGRTCTLWQHPGLQAGRPRRPHLLAKSAGFAVYAQRQHLQVPLADAEAPVVGHAGTSNTQARRTVRHPWLLGSGRTTTPQDLLNNVSASKLVVRKCTGHAIPFSAGRAHVKGCAQQRAASVRRIRKPCCPARGSVRATPCAVRRGNSCLTDNRPCTETSPLGNP